MAHFFLISGSEGRRTSWRQCAEWLRSHGHAVTAFGWEDLPWRQGYKGVVSFLQSQVRAATSPILMGHSAGGLLLPRISQVVEVRAEIYLAALVPQPELSFMEQIFSSPINIFKPEWVEVYHSRSIPSEVAILEELYMAPFLKYSQMNRL